MKLKIFSIYDLKAVAFITPFYCPNAALAKRGFQNARQDPAHAFHRNPTDYTLHELGEWDDTNASMEMYENAINHGFPPEEA